MASEFRLTGENLRFKSKLQIDLLPKGQWYKSVKDTVGRAIWDKLRKNVYERSGYKCECCESKENIGAYSRWKYTSENKQILMRLITMCEKCSLVTYFGRSQCIGRSEEAKQHLMEIRGFDDEEFKKHKKNAFDSWRKRSLKNWTQDLSILINSGYLQNNNFSTVSDSISESSSDSESESSSETKIEYVTNNSILLQIGATFKFFNQPNVGDVISLKIDSENNYDSTAIYCVNGDSKPIGYVSVGNGAKKRKVFNILENGQDVSGEIIFVTTPEGRSSQLYIISVDV